LKPKFEPCAFPQSPPWDLVHWTILLRELAGKSSKKKAAGAGAPAAFFGEFRSA
jgi:hypothetical protein